MEKKIRHSNDNKNCHQISNIIPKAICFLSSVLVSFFSFRSFFFVRADPASDRAEGHDAAERARPRGEAGGNRREGKQARWLPLLDALPGNRGACYVRCSRGTRPFIVSKSCLCVCSVFFIAFVLQRDDRVNGRVGGRCVW